MDEKYLKRMYLRPTFPGSFSGLAGFIENNNYKDKNAVDEILSSIRAYNSHKPARSKFSRRAMICPEIDSVWSMDLADIQKQKYSNKH
jgi:hypothetical protein